MLLGSDGDKLKLHWSDGRHYIPVQMTFRLKRIILKFGYNPGLIKEVKNMEGRKWHSDGKYWSVANSVRNTFQIRFLAKEFDNPYDRYKHKLQKVLTGRPLRDHQHDMVSFAQSRDASLWACEMGLGKTLCYIVLAEWYIQEVPESEQNREHWYVGPRAGVKAVTRELSKWEATFRPRMFTYEGLVKHVKAYEGIPPLTICYDEFSKIKTHTAQRSQAAMHVANGMREYNEYYRIVELSGTPAPKEPVDWWHPVEVACPGYIVESHPGRLKKRLSLIEERETQSGGVYPHLVTWFDDENKCKRCGEDKLATQHIDRNNRDFHLWQKSVNEVELMRKRLQHIVLVKKKSECTDLPDKVYEQVKVKPTVEILNTARMIKETSPRAITALIRLRELADGFQYTDRVSGEKICEYCEGRGTSKEFVATDFDPLAVQEHPDSYPEKEEVTCPSCGGIGKVKTYEQVTHNVGSPKDEVFKDDLDAYEDIGRYIVWGGFTGTLDRLVKMAHEKGWTTLRVDGKGYVGQSCTGERLDDAELLSAMDRSTENADELWRKHPKICFVGHPQAGGMALTLTASPIETFYSNDFSGEARMQAEDRAHRLGMGDSLLIKDLFLLPTDRLVYDNLMKKKKLQNLTLGELIIDE